MGLKNANSKSVDLSIPDELNGSNEYILTADGEVESALHSGTRYKEYFQYVFRKKTLYKRLPILTWLPRYCLPDFIGDLIAGFTVGLTVIPQSLAYASVAGLPTEFGLYGSFMGSFVYAILGSCKDVTIGSTAVASLFVFQVSNGIWQRAILLTFLTGIIEILMALSNLSFLVDFVSEPVSAGFTSAVALIVFTSQIKNILGIHAEGNSFLMVWVSIFKNINEFRVYDTILGLCCIVFLTIMKYVANIRIGPDDVKNQSTCQRIFNKSIWILGISRNAISVVACALIGSYLYSSENDHITLTGYIPSGMPNFKVPDFSIEEISNNGTIIQQGESFMEMMKNIGSGLIVVPMIALLESSSVCKAFANGKSVDVTQELIATGVSNIGNSLVQGYRINGGLGRSAINHASGVRTPLSNIYVGIISIIALLYMTPFFSYIPKASLAAMVICAVIYMVQFDVIKPIWKTKRIELIPFTITLGACLALPLEIGILIGITTNILFILRHAARPKITSTTKVTTNGIRYVMLTPDRSLVFPSAEFFRKVIAKHGLTLNLLTLVIDCTYIYSADFTAAKVMLSLISSFHSRNQRILFYNTKTNVAHVLKSVQKEIVFFYDLEHLEQAIDRAT